jgi:hypothetical protein
LIFELNFVAKNSKKKIAKNWVCGRKNQLRLGCVHTWTNSTGYTSIPPPHGHKVPSNKRKKKYEIKFLRVHFPTSQRSIGKKLNREKLFIR